MGHGAWESGARACLHSGIYGSGGDIHGRSVTVFDNGTWNFKRGI